MPEPTLREVFPHVRVDTTNHLVEFDSVLSPLLVPDPKAPLFFLEVLACLPDTREHETFVICQARPSHIHAAMLLIGLKPGEPGGWKMENDRLLPVDPRGDAVDVRFAYPDPTDNSKNVEIDPLEWIINANDQQPFIFAMRARAARDSRPAPGWIFTGSRIVKGRRAMQPDPDAPPGPAEVYDADQSGTVIGLTTFGSEVIGLSRTISPDSGIDEPEWIAKMNALPPAGTAIRVRLRPSK